MPGHDHTVELQDLCLQHPQLGAESGYTSAGDLGQPFVVWIGGDTEQLFDTIAPDRRDDAELRKKGTDDVDHRGLLADEQVPGTVQ